MDELKPIDPLAKTTARLVILCDTHSGQVAVSGHIDNVDLCVKMCVEAGHIIMERAAKLAMDAKRNGNGSESPPPSAA